MGEGKKLFSKSFFPSPGYRFNFISLMPQNRLLHRGASGGEVGEAAL